MALTANARSQNTAALAGNANFKGFTDDVASSNYPVFNGPATL